MDSPDYIELSSEDEDIKDIFMTKAPPRGTNIKGVRDYKTMRANIKQQEFGVKKEFVQSSNSSFAQNSTTSSASIHKPITNNNRTTTTNKNNSKNKQDDTGNKVNFSNCGIHTNDALNVPDDQGRILVNVDHPEEDPDVFVKPQLARALKPHQVGGIRFLYDNIIEDFAKFNNTPGEGCILAHSMGLGKTIQLCSFIDVFLSDLKGRHVLCIVPVNTLQNWLSEFEMWLPTKEQYSGFDTSIHFRNYNIFKMTTVKSLSNRVEVLKDWWDSGGVLLMGYELYRILTLNNEAKSGKNKQSSSHSGTNILDADDELSDSGSKMYKSQSRPGSSLSEMKEIIMKCLVKPGPDLVVCDEGHRIKNDKAATSKALKQITTRRRIVLTGYPLQNNMIEYWCMVDFVKPDYLGTKREYTVYFDKPIAAGQCIDSLPSEKKIMRYRAHVLHKILQGFVQRRSHSLLKSQLPRKHEHVILIRMTEIQRKLITAFIDKIIFNNVRTKFGKLKVSALFLFAVCCKVWNHPDVIRAVVKDGQIDYELDNLDDSDDTKPVKRKSPGSAAASHRPTYSSTSNIHDMYGESLGEAMLDTGNCSKVIDYGWAESLLEDYECGRIDNSYKTVLLMILIEETLKVGDRMLIFSQSLLTLDLIEEFISKQHVPFCPNNQRWRRDTNYFRIDGSSSPFEREQYIDMFNSNPSYKLFLISTKAGSLGINLTGANRIVIFDSSWNPCHDAQAACRVYRYGQTKECYVYRLVCDNTLEKRIYDRQINKQGMANRVVDELNHESRLTWEEITQLVLEFDGKSDPPVFEFDADSVKDISDPLVRKICLDHNQMITAKPFEHESLLLDHVDTKLTKAEMEAAQKNYESLKSKGRGADFNPNDFTENGIFLDIADLEVYLTSIGYLVRRTDLTQDLPDPNTGTPFIFAGEQVLLAENERGVFVKATQGRSLTLRGPRGRTNNQTEGLLDEAIFYKSSEESQKDKEKKCRPPPQMRTVEPEVIELSD